MVKPKEAVRKELKSNEIVPLFNPYQKKLDDAEAKALLKKMQGRPSDFKPPPKPEPVILKITEFTRNGIMTILFN